MVIDDDSKVNQSNYLNFIQFSYAELENDYKNSSNFIKRCWPSNKVVDLNLLLNLKVNTNEQFEKYRKHLALFKIDNMNFFTSYLPISEIYKNLQTVNGNPNVDHHNKINYSLLQLKRNLIIDLNTLYALVERKIINWSSTLVSLYPIQTIGDGNCLVNINLKLNYFGEVNSTLRLRCFKPD